MEFAAHYVIITSKRIVFPILPALILFFMQAHAGGERAFLPGVLDAWRLQAVVRGIDRETVKQVSGVILSQLRKEPTRIAPEQPERERSKAAFPPQDSSLAETYTAVQRSRDGPNGF